ncbi:uncharacterized protein LOC126847164 [Adelges cooleyi]|uniref:uncharacterized protein LOC126847164 n=1 Tax=Adelges cooleyi TaxID=133065 RepID=UPI00217FF478|nr:uncharacterized protein LOC126847164 [Adelges cooleyi]
MVKPCDDLSELKLVVRCVLTATLDALTIEELWTRVNYVFGGRNKVQLDMFGFYSLLEFFTSVPDIVQLEDPENDNSIVHLVSSTLSKHIEFLVSTNFQRPKISKTKISHRDLVIHYETQCAFMRIFLELYPKGLSIDEFESKILCLSIFKPFVECVEPLLYNLDHIFKKIGSSIILQQNIVDSINCIPKEIDKFTAEDIFNIEEHLLENEPNYVAERLKYPLINILEETVVNNIEQLLNEQLNWVSENKIIDLYIEKFGSTFSHYRRWGFSRVGQMFANLPELCRISFTESSEIQIIANNKCCDNQNNKINASSQSIISKLEPFKHSLCSIKSKSEKQPEEDDSVLKRCLRSDRYLEVPLDECFLDEEINLSPHIRLNCTLNVKVCRVNVNLFLPPTLFCQLLDESSEYTDMLSQMKEFYSIYQHKFKFNQTLTMVRQTYAYSLNDKWCRGVVSNIDMTDVKVINIDNGSVNCIPLENIRILYKQFSELPSQSFVCHLHGIRSIEEDEVKSIVDKECVVFIADIDKHTKSAGIKIKLASSKSDEYLNDMWIIHGVADPDYSSDED